MVHEPAMPEFFDPYSAWLGIARDEQPPHHYRLLDIALFEADPQLIATAADRRVAHVRTFRSGSHGALAGRITREILAARECLLETEKKSAYDARLRQVVGASSTLPVSATSPAPAAHIRRPMPRPRAGVVVAAPAPNASAPPGTIQIPSSPPVIHMTDSAAGGPGPVSRRRWTERSATIVMGVLSVLGISLALWILKQPPADSFTSSADRAGRVPPNPPPPRPTVPIRQSHGTPRRAPASSSVSSQTNRPRTLTWERVAAPDAEAIRVAITQIEQDFAGQSPQQLRFAALKSTTAPTRYALFDAAIRVAVQAVDVRQAMTGVDTLNKDFEIDEFEVRAETLMRLFDIASTNTAYREIAVVQLHLVDRAIAANRFAVARQIAVAALRAARRSEDMSIINQAALAVLRAQQSELG